MKHVQLVATDLDGTFLKNDRTISHKSLLALNGLGDRKIIRVAATGRNLFKVREVVGDDVPFDFVVFSSGAGVFDWNKKTHLFNQNISEKSSRQLMNYLIHKDLNFHAFFPVPENHKHWFYRGTKLCSEFEKYFDFNRTFSIEIERNSIPTSELCQFLVIIPENAKLFQTIKNDLESQCNEIRVIRTSSPITRGYIWIEIFHKSVSKGNGVKFVCDLTGIAYKNTIGVGNDYNDFDLLAFTEYSFLTKNAPQEIQKRYRLVPSNENEAFAFTVQPLLE